MKVIFHNQVKVQFKISLFKLLAAFIALLITALSFLLPIMSTLLIHFKSSSTNWNLRRVLLATYSKLDTWIMHVLYSRIRIFVMKVTFGKLPSAFAFHRSRAAEWCSCNSHASTQYIKLSIAQLLHEKGIVDIHSSCYYSPSVYSTLSRNKGVGNCSQVLSLFNDAVRRHA